MKKLHPISRLVILIASLAMLSAYYVPLWEILMWAPQYPEGLQMKIWIDTLTGDVKIISALNHYIGMKHIEVSMFPEFKYMIYIVGAVIGIGVLTAALNKRYMLIVFTAVMLLTGIAALVDFYLWGYDYGHNLDPTAPIIVPGMSYQPPLIGTKQLLNFTAYSGPAIGGWIFFGSGLLTIGSLILEMYQSKAKLRQIVAPGIILLCMSACKVESEPLHFGTDGCHNCKMTLMDTKFGAELITTKGKVYKFDDVNCMLTFYHAGTVAPEDIGELLIINFSSPKTLIDARNALYLRSESIKSPMGSNVAAFGTEEELRGIIDTAKGTIMRWQELKTKHQ